MSDSDSKRHLVASSQALQDYLDQLFGQVRERGGEGVSSAPAAEPSPDPEQDPLQTQSPTASSLDASVPERAVQSPEESHKDDQLDELDDLDEDLAGLDDGRTFYLFEVAGLTLAIPQARFEREIAVPEIMTPPLGHDWRRIAETPSGPLIVVDTASLVLDQPDRSFPDKRVTHLVVLDSGNWALAAHGPGVRESIALDQVHWRSTSGRRPWLAGTHAARGCALLDLDEIGRMAL